MNEFTYKRKEQAVSTGTKVKQKDRTLLLIDPQNLFSRLIALALDL